MRWRSGTCHQRQRGLYRDSTRLISAMACNTPFNLYGRIALATAVTAAQLFAAADSRPFAGPALSRLVLRSVRRQPGRQVKAASG